MWVNVLVRFLRSVFFSFGSYNSSRRFSRIRWSFLGDEIFVSGKMIYDASYQFFKISCTVRGECSSAVLILAFTLVTEEYPRL